MRLEVERWLLFLLVSEQELLLEDSCSVLFLHMIPVVARWKFLLQWMETQNHLRFAYWMILVEQDVKVVRWCCWWLLEVHYYYSVGFLVLVLKNWSDYLQNIDKKVKTQYHLHIEDDATFSHEIVIHSDLHSKFWKVISLQATDNYLLTSSLTHIGASIKAAESIVKTVQILDTHTPAVWLSASTGGHWRKRADHWTWVNNCCWCCQTLWLSTDDVLRLYCSNWSWGRIWFSWRYQRWRLLRNLATHLKHSQSLVHTGLWILNS